ncbi:ABC transporter ATP-binding protein [Faecalispora anaeroviscerum]|uniref:ABC transporter ATP-binding protein n=1 Tax=Faecalispora anaeroviscerum TaxID=2991836 RepID=UPI0024B9A33B|nr:ABC transporter ATP-binding protein [Faecalispora anaeroviscerum]
MLKKIQRAFALSEQGAKDLINGSVACVFRDLALMFPVGLMYCLVRDLLTGVAPNLPYYVAGIFLCLALIFVTTYFEYNTTYLATYTESGVRRISLAEKLRKIPLSFFGKKDLSDLTSTIMADCAYLETSFSHYIPALFGSIVSTVVVAASLFVFDWRMALAALWVIPVSFLIVALSVRVQDALNQKQMDAKMACADGIQECLESVRDLKSNNAEEDYLKGLDGKIKAVEKRAIISELGTALFVVTAQLVLKIGIATVALTGAILLVKGTLDLLTFFMFLLVASRLYDPFQTALQNFAAVLSTRTHVARMNEILDHPVQSGSQEFHPHGCDITFDHVAFAYNGEEDVLREVSFTAKQGEVTALVGPSGGGKTTVSRLAARFWDASKGKITLGGKDISQIDPETLLSMYSIVFQEVTLFNNTVMENIRIGRRDASDEAVIAAAKEARCDEFVSQMPNGYQTMIGENGTALSGGERQRISIARALLKDAPIVLLDEATASLDVENETLIQSAISELVKNKTVLVIAHRMRTVAGADQIIVLSDGTVAEQGTPWELMQQDGIYRHMVELQTK